jgi:hypothetical protein
MVRPIWLTRVSVTGLLLAGAGLAALLPAGPAAAEPDLTLVTGQSVTDSADSKEAAAACPANTRVLGGGGYIQGGGRSVHLTRLQASGGSDTFYAGATERAAYANNWRVFAYAICGAAPAGLEYISYTEANDDGDDSTSATATCSAGKKLLSTGARILNGDGQVLLDDLVPSAALTSVNVKAFEDESGYAGDWTLAAYGVCANPVAGLQRVSDDGTVGASEDEAVGVPCPAGKKAYGMGASIVGGYGEAHFGGLYPSGDLDSATVVTVEDPTGQDDNWWSVIYAICGS